jgi:cytochrome P450
MRVSTIFAGLGLAVSLAVAAPIVTKFPDPFVLKEDQIGQFMPLIREHMTPILGAEAAADLTEEQVKPFLPMIQTQIDEFLAPYKSGEKEFTKEELEPYLPQIRQGIADYLSQVLGGEKTVVARDDTFTLSGDKLGEAMPMIREVMVEFMGADAANKLTEDQVKPFLPMIQAEVQKLAPGKTEFTRAELNSYLPQIREEIKKKFGGKMLASMVTRDE